jgi:hypothetical protein
VKISRRIIGVANRSPPAAADQCGGLAYLLIGVGPTVTAGMWSWDDSQIRPKIDPHGDRLGQTTARVTVELRYLSLAAVS